MHSRIFAACIALASLTFALPAYAAAPVNLIKNGSFDAGPKPVPFATYAKGSTAIPGWIVTFGTVDLIGPQWHDADGGGYSIDMDGTPGPGGLAQSFPTRRRAKYTVAFALASNPECGPRVKVLLVSVDGVRKRYAFDSAGKSDSNMGWQTKSFTFIASSSRSTLAFASLDVGSNCGPAIDKVSVTRR